MASSDPVSDGLTKLRNASCARHLVVEIRFSRFFAKILDILKQEGFIRAYKTVGEKPAQRMLRVYLKYVNKTPAIMHLIRISKPGGRVYRKAKELPRVLGGLGVAVVSTSKGVTTERLAYQQRIGGEVICYVW